MLVLGPEVMAYHVAACILIVALISLVSLFQLKGLAKWAFTVIGLLAVIVHYAILFKMAHYESIRITPFFVIEEARGYTAISPDYGQLIIAASLYLWRSEVAGAFKSLITGVKKRWL